MVKKSFETKIVKHVTIEIDETKITSEIMQEYNDMITWIGDDVNDHIRNIAEAYNREQWWEGDMFLEGYGNLEEEFGVKVVSSQEYEVETEEF